jgi:hypothetical protein
MKFPTCNVIGTKQGTCICYFFLLDRRAALLECEDILFFAQVLGVGAHLAGSSHMECVIAHARGNFGKTLCPENS